eukprot:549015-Amphidinium_carterae.1
MVKAQELEEGTLAKRLWCCDLLSSRWQGCDQPSSYVLRLQAAVELQSKRLAELEKKCEAGCALFKRFESQVQHRTISICAMVL